MGNKRIYQAAKEFGLTSIALVNLLQSLGYEVKNHMSTMLPDMENAVRKRFDEEREAARLEEEKKKKMHESEAAPDKKKDGKKTKRRRKFVDKVVVDTKLTQTLHQIRTGDKRKKRKIDVKAPAEQVQEEKKVLRVSEFMSVTELSKRLDVGPNDIISICLSLGLVVSVNQRLDIDVISAVADEFGYEVELLPEWGEDILDTDTDEEEKEIQLGKRAPIVSVMGHVDHGKTSLLDFIRRSRVAEQEVGSITQHISAYEVVHNKDKITFLDTPGHELFTAMRARGAQLTDICVLVVAVNDGVKPQTVEAIDHVKAAGIPIIVALNKIDLGKANIEKVKQQLLERKIMVEDYGGKVQCVPISAKTGEGIDELLDAILIEAEMLDLKTSFEAKAKGTIIEASVEKGRGMMADILITEGVAKIGDPFIAGSSSGRIRAMFNELDEKIDNVMPSQPVKIMGFDKLPDVGDTFQVVQEERKAREIARKRILVEKFQQSRMKTFTAETLQSVLENGEQNKLNLILKCDVGGSLEALADGLARLPQDEISLTIVHKAVGPVNENDVLLAQSSGAIIIAYNVPVRTEASKLAVARKIVIKSYNIIFEAIESIRKAMSGLLEPEYEERIIGKAEIRNVFVISKAGVICGSYVFDGEIKRGAYARLKRKGEILHQGKINSLKRFKDDVRKVETNFECGISIENLGDAQEGDIIECCEKVLMTREL
ncbi:translation initiation factor IF-2 [candidate division WOR-3 bacterium]|nr:translation initiation factor IF-2 [candidate division WOR-3 bacterium]